MAASSSPPGNGLRRILLKLSGEALMGEEDYGIDPKMLKRVAMEIREVMSLGMQVAVHSSGELGIQLASMLHLGAVLPNLSYTADAHYHHLVDDVIAGGKLRYEGGAIRVPDAPGLGVTLDREKLDRYHALYRELGGYPYDRDPGRPGWFAHVPNRDWADPAASVTPTL